MAKKTTKKEPPRAPRGMRDIMGNEYYDYQGFFEKAQEVAIYWGFKPIETPILEQEEVFARGVGEETDIVEKEMYRLRARGKSKLAMRPEGTAGVVRAYIEHGMQSQPQPIMFYYYGPFFRHEKPQRGRLRELRQFGIEILGTEKSVADAITIRVMLSILNDAGAKNLIVDINSIGDKECRPDYIRELVTYYKRHADSICADCRKRLKTNPLRVLDCKAEKCHAVKENAPDSVSFLCSGCKKHFTQVLEFLEEAGITYRLNKNLVRGLDYYTRTVFEIISDAEARGEEIDLPAGKAGKPTAGVEKGEESPQADEGEEAAPLALAGGGRYDYLAKALGHKKDVPAVGGSIGVDRVLSAPWIKKLSPRIIKKPKVYFISLGDEAKLKSLKIIEILRKGRIPITHSISKDSISTQLGTAEKLGVPYVVIFGQKEALENSIIVRNMDKRSQKTIKIEKLLEYMKKLK